MRSINPATGEQLSDTTPLTTGVLQEKLEAARVMATRWSQSTHSQRSDLLITIAEKLDTEQEDLARLMTCEMGKRIDEARAEVDKCALGCRYYAEHAAAILADQEVETDARRSLIAFQPVGVVLAIMPWNFPLWQVVRFLAPAIAAGNVGLLKHAPNVMGCAQALERIVREAGAPEGLFTNLPISTNQTAGVIADHRVKAVTLTGSVGAGRIVGSLAGKALKPSVLELGGSDAFVVLEDADLDLAISRGVLSRFMNAGQSCIAAKRFIVVEAIAEEFTERLVEAVSGLRLGDPLDENTQVAPMARADLREQLHEQVSRCVGMGATALCGGAPQDGPGFYYQPTVLTGITEAMPAFSEELFGPVASLFRVADEAAALTLANATDFGLGGSVWTRDRARGLAFARQLECGNAFVNELVKSDPRLPFGGIKTSGYGRELAAQGLLEFVNVKTIWVD